MGVMQGCFTGAVFGLGLTLNMIGAEIMTKKQKKLMSELRCIADGPVAWDFATVDVDAIKLALAEIERLTQENADLTSKLERESNKELTRKNAELAILCVDSKREIVRLKLRVNAQLDARLKAAAFVRYDVKKEVIE